MEIIIDGKVYECVEKVEKKPDTIMVPDNIEFENTPGAYLGMKFDNNRSLYWFKSKNNYYVEDFDHLYKVQCKLTPIDRKDIEVGDWVYYSSRDDANELFDAVYQYALYVGDDNFKFIDSTKSGFFENKLSLSKYIFWRVEKV